MPSPSPAPENAPDENGPLTGAASAATTFSGIPRPVSLT